MISKKYFQEYLSANKTSKYFCQILSNEIVFKWQLPFLCSTMPSVIFVFDSRAPIYHPCSYIVSNTNVPQGLYPSSDIPVVSHISYQSACLTKSGKRQRCWGYFCSSAFQPWQPLRWREGYWVLRLFRPPLIEYWKWNRPTSQLLQTVI